MFSMLCALTTTPTQASKIDQAVTGATREGGPLGGRELPCLDEGRIDKLLSSLDVLESLGHAKTLENENSSRFGWFAKLYFNGNMVLDGCHIDTMFLETSRVVAPKPEERNFHVFYQLLRGLDPGLKQALATQQVASYDILHTGTQDVHGFNDAEEWQSKLTKIFISTITHSPISFFKSSFNSTHIQLFLFFVSPFSFISRFLGRTLFCGYERR
jgi:hypothetical protein